jgi:DNA-binding PadR family transcriptional regulator
MATETMSNRAAEPALANAPRSVEETGLPFQFLVDLLTKVLFLRGQIRLTALAAHTKLSISVLDPVLSFMRGEKLCEMSRRGNSGTDADLGYNLTDTGRARAGELMRHNTYAGAAPVTLGAYAAQVEAQSVAHMHITERDMARELNQIAIAPDVLVQVGAAMNSGRAIFIHGPAGSGKTYLAERLRCLLKGSILVPHAIMVDSEVLPFYDPRTHAGMPDETPEPDSFDRRAPLDTRWVRMQRPAVLTGGELTLDMLDLQFDEGARRYHSPPHLMANNGIFIIDDLGRQRCSPVELMNRWIVPMDRREDFLTLHTGYKFRVPFDVIVVFSSNFPPHQLADGAFLRRIGYKIHVGALSEAQYGQVFAEVCARYGLAGGASALHYLLHEHHYKEQRPLLACYPRDILCQVRERARYEDVAAVLEPGVLDWAWSNYFGAGDTVAAP